MTKMMTKDQISYFVEDVAATGCDIKAIPGVGYVIGDTDLSDEEYERIAPELRKINERYGARDHLLKEISEYLISIGRFISLAHISLDVQTSSDMKN